MQTLNIICERDITLFLGVLTQIKHQALGKVVTIDLVETQLGQQQNIILKKANLSPFEHS